VSAHRVTQIVCVDLDSTLADTRPRRDYCPTVNPAYSWEDYWARCGDDAPMAGTITAVGMFHRAGYAIAVVSNRSDATYYPTARWLDRFEVPCQDLLMRPASFPIEDDRWKLHCVTTINATGSAVKLFLEDNPITAAAIEAAGVPVLCVNPRYATRPALTS
jgi:uncharacterized HAD superfamily protein